MEDFLKELACFACSYAEDCDEEWAPGHSHCEEMMDNAKAFAEKTGIRIMKGDTYENDPG